MFYIFFLEKRVPTYIAELTLNGRLREKTDDKDEVFFSSNS